MVPPRVPNPPARFAVSLIDPPTRAVGVATVVRTGVAWLTTLVSPGSLHAVAVARSEERRVGIACRRRWSACLGENESKFAVQVPPPEVPTAFVLVMFAAEADVASRDVTGVQTCVLPSLPNPPARFAVSLIDPPTRAVGVATVVRTGVAWLTTLVSPGSLHAVAVAALLVSPL